MQSQNGSFAVRRANVVPNIFVQFVHQVDREHLRNDRCSAVK